mmetsp:Transcript_221/g.737  ORF Transcript_221/g.737 Transcript_221/m.737 type:complete len:87 (+) Transcript_221:1058-1318(+)
MSDVVKFPRRHTFSTLATPAPELRSYRELLQHLQKTSLLSFDVLNKLSMLLEYHHSCQRTRRRKRRELWGKGKFFPENVKQMRQQW